MIISITILITIIVSLSDEHDMRLIYKESVRLKKLTKLCVSGGTKSHLCDNAKRVLEKVGHPICSTIEENKRKILYEISPGFRSSFL